MLVCTPWPLLPGPYRTSLALDLDSVSAPGLMSLPSPWICLPEPACFSALPGVPVFAQSPLKWPVAAHPAPASASAYQLVSLDQSAIQHQTSVSGTPLHGHSGTLPDQPPSC
ncbi:hypothetical protein ILYODFUR_039119 [Ilyodon furcidens]|uniref:Uncharacterized protein n=1 Tax=Ilyodon furcidens TaxID=33524 RepID=A0ABV0TSA2_9TELE